MGQPEVVFHPEAAAEYSAACTWYASRDPAAAQRFEHEIEVAVRRIAENPLRWPRYDDQHRKLILRRFPYLLILREYQARIWIVAVAHGHRRPGYWRSRVVPG